MTGARSIPGGAAPGSSLFRARPRQPYAPYALRHEPELITRTDSGKHQFSYSEVVSGALSDFMPDIRRRPSP